MSNINLSDILVENLIREAGNPIHSYLFFGQKKSRIGSAADFLIKLIFCENSKDQPCGACDNCQKIGSANHPDLIKILPTTSKSGKTKKILIDQIHQINHLVSLVPYSAKFKIVTIFDIDLATLDAQNALLKLLEEPPSDTIFLLQTTKVNSLLPTILSRCRKIKVDNYSNLEIAKQLQLRGLDSDTALEIAKIAAGDMKKARFLSKEANWQQYKTQARSIFTLLVQKDLSNFFTIIDSISKDSKKSKNVLAIFRTLLRDIYLVKFNLDEMVANQFMISQIQESKNQFTVEQVISLLQFINQSSILIKSNINSKMLLENLVLKI
jgi:DNA polymerase-3 subunit delta'